MVVADKSKKSKVEEEPEQIDQELVLSIEKLQEVQDELEKVNEEASDKVLEVEQQYNVIRRPVYEKRSEIIKSIPDFWLTAFLSHPALAEYLNEEDQKVFKHLSSLDVEDFQDLKSGYSISFFFNPNPFFENTKLTKTFSFSDDGATGITGTVIEWKEGMDITIDKDRDKKGNKRLLPDECSFFSWFDSNPESALEIDGFQDEIADLVKEDLWPNPLRYFNNDADEEDMEEDEDGDEEDDEEKANGGEEDDDDEDANDEGEDD